MDGSGLIWMCESVVCPGASDRNFEQMKPRAARDSFDTKSEFPAIATPQPPPPPMKPNSILRFSLPSSLSPPSLRVVITEHEVDIISRKGKAREGGREGDVHVQGVQLNCAKQIADKNTFRLSRVRLNEGCLWRETLIFILWRAHTV